MEIHSAMQVLEEILELSPAELLAMERLPVAPEDCAYLSGSLVEGLGNTASDVDIFVISEYPPRDGTLLHKRECSISIHFRGSRRIDFEYWSRCYIAELADRLAVIMPGHDFVADKLTPSEELFIHRLRIGIPILNEQAVEALRARYDFDKFCSYLGQQAIHRIDGALEDIRGMQAIGDVDTAIFRARDVVGFAVDAFLYSKGNTNTLPKWRSKLLARLGHSRLDKSVRERFWHLQFPPNHDLRDGKRSREYVEDCVRFADQVVRHLQP